MIRCVETPLRISASDSYTGAANLELTRSFLLLCFSLSLLLSSGFFGV